MCDLDLRIAELGNEQIGTHLGGGEIKKIYTTSNAKYFNNGLF